jgi:hypothetical protein
MHKVNRFRDVAGCPRNFQKVSAIYFSHKEVDNRRRFI